MEVCLLWSNAEFCRVIHTGLLFREAGQLTSLREDLVTQQQTEHILVSQLCTCIVAWGQHILIKFHALNGGMVAWCLSVHYMAT